MKPLIDPINTSDGQFHGRNKATGELATIVTPDYMNDTQAATLSLQREIIRILSASNIKPDEATDNQLLSALNALFLTSDDTLVAGALQKDQNLADLTDVAEAVKNLGLDNIDGKYTRGWRIDEPGSGVHYTRLAEVWYKDSDKSSSVTLLISGANATGDGPRQTDIVTCTFHNVSPKSVLNVEHLVVRDAASADTRATYGYTFSGTNKVDIWLIHPDYSGDTAVSVISGTSDHITLFTDAGPVTDAPASLHVIAPSFVWSDEHKATARDVDAVSASEGGMFGGVVTVTDELNTVATPGTDASDGDYLNGGLLRSFLSGRGANTDTRGAYTSLYIQEHVGSEHAAILNLNGFEKDCNWLFKSDSSFHSDGAIYEAGQRVYSPNNCPWPVGAVLQMGNDTDPSTVYFGTTWKDLGTDYNGRVLAIGPAGETGGNNSVTLSADNLPDHKHKAGDQAPGGEWDASTTHGTDNQKSASRGYTSETLTTDNKGVTNAPFSVRNEYVAFRTWMRTA